MHRAMIWKEWREQRVVMLAGIAIAIDARRTEGRGTRGDLLVISGAEADAEGQSHGEREHRVSPLRLDRKEPGSKVFVLGRWSYRCSRSEPTNPSPVLPVLRRGPLLARSQSKAASL